MIHVIFLSFSSLLLFNIYVFIIYYILSTKYYYYYYYYFSDDSYRVSLFWHTRKPDFGKSRSNIQYNGSIFVQKMQQKLHSPLTDRSLLFPAISAPKPTTSFQDLSKICAHPLPVRVSLHMARSFFDGVACGCPFCSGDTHSLFFSFFKKKK